MEDEKATDAPAESPAPPPAPPMGYTPPEKVQRRSCPPSALVYTHLLPNLQSVARLHGYALAVHGSMQSDLDLIACPWVDKATDRETLVEALREAVGGVFDVPPPGWTTNPSPRSHGRMAWTIYPSEELAERRVGVYLDISVMPLKPPLHRSLVRQEHKMGCGVAVIAMLTGETYAEVAAAFPDKDLAEVGVGDLEIRDYIKGHGAKFGEWRLESQGGGAWPPEPFEGIHLCNVHVYPWSPCNHWVLMQDDGQVLDPLCPHSLKLSDYDAVNSVVAIVFD